MSATNVSSAIADPLVNQIEHFVEVIVTKMAPIVSGREGLRTLAVIDAIQVAAKTGKTIQLTKIDNNRTLRKYDRLQATKSHSSQKPQIWRASGRHFKMYNKINRRTAMAALLALGIVGGASAPSDAADITFTPRDVRY